MDVNNTILFPNNVDSKKLAGQQATQEVAKKPIEQLKALQASDEETKIPTEQEVAQKVAIAEQLAGEGTTLERGSLVNFLV